MSHSLTFEGLTNCFCKVAALFYTSNERGFQFLHIFTNSCYNFFYILAILIGVKWCLTVALIYISLIVNGIEHLLICLLAICIINKYFMNVYIDTKAVSRMPSIVIRIVIIPMNDQKV